MRNNNGNKRNASSNKGKGNSRGRSQISYDRDYDKKRDKDYIDDREFKKSAKKNDPKWYAVDEQLLNDAASIPFSWSTGTVTPLGNGTLFSKQLDVPGILAVAVAPSIGWCQNPSDPANIAASSIYSWVRHANSGSANYDAPDLMLYLLAMSQVYSGIVWLERIYAESMLYSQRNRYLPSGLLWAEGMNGQDVTQNLADFRYRINAIINKAASFSVPANMTFFQRQAFMYQNIYIEGSSMKDQMYMYTPAGFWKYDVGSQGGLLNIVNTGVPQLAVSSFTGWTHTQACDLIEGLLQPIMASEDMNIMSGDILKAYGQDGTLKLVPLEEVRPISPIFDIGVLEQIKNATVATVNYGSLGVTQNPTTNALRSAPIVRFAQISGLSTDEDAWYNALDALRNYVPLTTTTEDTSPGLVMESSRMIMSAVEQPQSTNNNAYYDINVYTGTEVPEMMYMIRMSAGKPTLVNSAFFTSNYPIVVGSSSTGAGIVSLYRAIANLSNFDFHPRFRPFLSTTQTSSAQLNAFDTDIFDVDNYAVLTPQDIRRLHETALMSEFHVPAVSKVG